MAERELVLNIKAMIMFEKLTGESYFQINDQNYIYLIYTIYTLNDITVFHFFYMQKTSKRQN